MSYESDQLDIIMQQMKRALDQWCQYEQTYGKAKTAVRKLECRFEQLREEF